MYKSLKQLPDFKTVISLLALLVLQSCLIGSSTSEDKHNEAVTTLKPAEEVLARYKDQTTFTDPGDFTHLLLSVPDSYDQICDLIKKQLIHPMEAAELPEVFPEDKLPEDGQYPVVADMLKELERRNQAGLTMDRLPEERLLVACYHHALLFASILRHQGTAVRLRSGYARYYEEQINVRFSHIICEVWDTKSEQWVIIDPDRNMQNISNHMFELPCHVWKNYVNNDLPDSRYIGSMGQGENIYIHSLLMDMAFVLSNERNYWHTPEFIFGKDFDIKNLSSEQMNILNQIAELMIHPDENLAQLEEIYADHPFLQTHERDISVYYE